MTFRSFVSVSALLLLLIASGSAFSVSPIPSTAPQQSSTSLNFFGDALKGAFSNDDSLGKAQNAGLKNVSDSTHYSMTLFQIYQSIYAFFSLYICFGCELYFCTSWKNKQK